MYGQSSGGTAILALLASPLATGLFQSAWLASASPLLNKTATDAYKDNVVFVRNTGCANVSCLYDLSPEDVINSIPWDEYPYWNMMSDQNNLPTNGLFIGALAIVDGNVCINPLYPLRYICFVDSSVLQCSVLYVNPIQVNGSFPSQIEITLLSYYSVLGYQSKKRRKRSGINTIRNHT